MNDDEQEQEQEQEEYEDQEDAQDNSDYDDDEDEDEEEEEEEDEEDDEDATLARLSEHYKSSRSASYVMDRDDEEEEEDDDDEEEEEDEQAQRSSTSYDADGDYDSDGDELMRSVDGGSQRQARQMRRRRDSANNTSGEASTGGVGAGTAAGSALGVAGLSGGAPNPLTENLGRMFPEALGLFGGGGGFGDNGMRISALVDGLRRRDSSFLVLENLNELSERILMMNGISAERYLPVYRLSQNLVDILQETAFQEDLELQLVTCRCMYNLLAVNVEFTNELVCCGALEALQSKLFEISYIDLAEQALQTLEMMSRVRGRDIMRKNCLSAVLQYLDFFTIHAQRKALITTANSCQSIDLDSFEKVKEIFPTIEGVACEYSDSISVENAWLSISRIIQSFRRKPEFLEELIKPQLLIRLCEILPSSAGKGRNTSTNLLSFSTSLKLLTSLSILANISSKLAIMIIKDCQIGKVINKTFANYDSHSKNDEILSASTSASASASEADLITTTVADKKDVERSINTSSVSIEALMSAPKDLILSFIKLICLLLPYLEENTDSQDFKSPFEVSIGGFYSTTKNEIREKIKEEKTIVYKENFAVFAEFIIDVFPILLSIYSSTVDYNVRRIVLIDLLRIVNLLTKEQLESTILKSNITNLLASVVIQSKSIIRRELSSSISGSDPKLDQVLSSFKNSNKLHPYILLLGSLLLTQHLCNKAPTSFLNEFEREGLLADASELLKTLKSDEEILNNFEEQEKKNRTRRNSVHFDEDFCEAAADNQSSHEEEHESSQEEGDYQYEDGAHHSEDDGEDDPFSMEEDETNSPPPTLRNTSLAFSVNMYRSFDDNAITYDNLSMITLPIILRDLIKVASEIQIQYEKLKASNSSNVALHMMLLEQLSSILSNSSKLVDLGYDDWVDIWKTLSRALGDNVSKLSTISSFELISSGIVELLLSLFKSDIGGEGSVCYKSFQQTFCQRFVREEAGDVPIVLLVNKLQEALTRSESFEIITSGSPNLNSVILSSGSQSNLNNTIATVMAKQIKIRLVSADDNVPENSQQMILAVQAIATFKSIHTFLKNRFETLDQLLRLRDFQRLRSGSGNEVSNFPLAKMSRNQFHIEFLIDGEVVPHETTVYGAIYRSLQKEPNETVDPKLVWTSQPHVIRFREVAGSVPKEEENEEWYPYDTSKEELESMKDSSTINILELLKILFDMNRSYKDSGSSSTLFINYKLTAKLNRQLEELLVVASGTLPGWSVHITRKFPFLFPTETRMFFLRSTSFGYSRLIQQWQMRSNQEDENSNSSNLNSLQLGRPSRHKIRISRKNLLQCAIKVLDLYATIPSLIEIEYVDEVGTGLGPTLEFYANVSKEFSRKKVRLWREDGDQSNEFVNYKTGLFPVPMDDKFSESKNGAKILQLFNILGRFIARALLDSRIIDFAFNPLFFSIAKNFIESDTKKHGYHSKLAALEEVELVDPDLARSLRHLTKYVEQYDKVEKKEAVTVDGCTLEDLSLTFSLPGYPYVELISNGADVPVNSSNLEEFIDKVIDLTIGSGVRCQIHAFVDGFSKVFPYSSMSIFSPEELVTLFGNGAEDWSYETLLSSIHADHGYNIESKSVASLLEIMSEFDKEERRKFLQFLTGSPRLPIGGFKNLRPNLTVVCKRSEDGLKPDDYLPSVMTCANYLKLPDYSSKMVMKKRIVHAFNEGSGAFLLS
ncbi:hypothetical protein PACTADRAFT_42344 [Pachysolen tannophilus NRRL Y-2460]|uniref:HECT-type E3 ubiquitin transferase n=1 Tax=Pachysolen tannophilus NRRL Y-2460 TaxID=669874 RepID=A0A1E4TU58_PACTA|nr:hypothetical protein PACTADRAFT_42344 [Pachysolen tannophilus NRRL Y-2460]